MAKKKSKLWFTGWWDKINPTWQAVISIGMVFSAGFAVGRFIDIHRHSMEVIELNQQHNLDLQQQHDEFEGKLLEVKNQYEECKHQYRLLEIENKKKKDGDEK